MKLNKIIISLILMFSFCFPYGNVSALENQYIYTPTKEEFEKEQEKQIELMKATFGSTRESYAYDYRKIGDPKLSSFSAYKDAYDQPPGGSIFPNERSGFYWSDDDRSPGSFSLGIAIGGQNLAVSAAYAPGATKNSGGAIISINSNQVGKAVKLKVARNYLVQRYDVYRKPQYSGTWTYLRSYGVATKYQAKYKIS